MLPVGCLLLLATTSVQAQDQKITDLFPIFVDGKSGYMDRKGQVRISPRFSYGGYFSEGRAVASVPEDRKLGFIDETGNFINKSRFDVAKDFSDGLAAVGYGTYGLNWTSNHKWGYINRDGTFTIKPQFKNTYGFFEGLAAVENDEGNWGFIDKRGKVIIPFDYKYVVSFSEGLACVLIDGNFGFIDKSGKIVIKPVYSMPNKFHEGLAHLAVGDTKEVNLKTQRLFTPAADDLRVFIDKTGKIVFQLPKRAVGAYNFSEGLAQIIMPDGLTAFIDRNGKYVIRPKDYDLAGNFSAGLAPVIVNEKVSFINKTGKIVMKTDYSHAEDFRHGLSWARKGRTIDEGGDGKNIEYYYIDTNGKVVWQSGK